jgi:hypothetical protein
MEFNLGIDSWAAWAPGLETRQDWLSWDFNINSMPSDYSLPIPSDHVPKLLKRRLSPLARIVFHVINQCITPDQTMPAVFASGSGEINNALSLLHDLQNNEELSPAGFSLSVHNGIAGLFSMVYHNTYEIVVIASAGNGIVSGFQEALGILNEGVEQVLLVFYEEPIPVFFPTEPFKLDSGFPLALALKLSSNSSQLTLIAQRIDQLQQEQGEQSIQLLEFIQFLVSDKLNIILDGLQCSWQWEKYDSN